MFNHNQFTHPSGTINAECSYFLQHPCHNETLINAMLCTSQGQRLAFISISWLTVNGHFPRRLCSPVIHMGRAAPHTELVVEKELLWQFVWPCSAGTLNMATTTASSNSRRRLCFTHAEGRIGLMEGGLQMFCACAYEGILGIYMGEFCLVCWCLFVLHNACK